MRRDDREFIQRYGERSWVMLRAYKNKGKIIFEESKQILWLMNVVGKQKLCKRSFWRWLKRIDNSTDI